MKRQSNFEWLRILAMVMVVTMHCLYKSEATVANLHTSTADEILCLKNMVFAIMTTLSLCAVNVYVLISGYFLLEAEYKSNRLIKLVIQVIEYSVLVLVIMVIVGKVSLSDLTIYDVLGYLFPIGTEEYWFVSSYAVLYLLSPLLAKGVKAIDKKTHKYIIGGLLFFTCIEKTLIPMKLPTDSHGYNSTWFIVLFLIAAYIRQYGISFLEGHTYRSFFAYIISATIIYMNYVGIGYFGLRLSKDILLHYASLSLDYNFVFVLTESIGLFYLFKNLNLNEESKGAKVARFVGPLTLGVYLLHEHIAIRYEWQSWFGVTKDATVLRTFIGWILGVVVIFVVGVAVEWCRRKLHTKIGSIFNAQKV